MQPLAPLFLVLDNIRSRLNIGAIFRSADAFGVSKIFLCGISATPPHREIEKTALGATQSVAWSYYEHTEDAIHFLIQQNSLPIAIEQSKESIPLHTFSIDTHTSYALILGNELHGVQTSLLPLAHKILHIPQQGQKQSLNVAVCAGIALWFFNNAQLA